MKYIKTLTLFSFALLLILLILSVFFSWVLIFSLPVVIALTVFLLLRIKYYLSLIPILTAIILGLALNFSYILLIAVIIYAVGVLGGIFGVKFKGFIKGLVIMTSSLAVGFIIIFSGFYIVKGQSPTVVIPEYIKTSHNEKVVAEAKSMYVDFVMERDYPLLTGTDRENALFNAKKQADDEANLSVVMDFYANYIDWYINQNLTNIIFGSISAIGISSYLVIIFLVEIKQKDLEENKHPIFITKSYKIANAESIRMPSGYLLGTFIPLIILNVLASAYIECEIIYKTLLLSFINIPFFIFGCIALAKFSAITKNYLLVFIVIMLAVFVSIITIVVVGIIDYLLKDFIRIDENALKKGDK